MLTPKAGLTGFVLCGPRGSKTIKWFKHETDAFMSEGVAALVAAGGFAWYGRWNRLLEIVAFKMDKTSRCYVEYPIQTWCSLLGLKQKKLILFLKATEKELKTKVTRFENIIRIEIPNLLKKRDNYTKDLEGKSKQLPSIDVDLEVDLKSTKTEAKPKKQPPSKLSDEEWLAAIKANTAYKGFDVDRIKGRFEAWCLTNGKDPTRRRFVNWLNREDVPLKKGQPDITGGKYEKYRHGAKSD